MLRVEVKPELFRWASERAGITIGALAERLPQLPVWERGELRPTLKQAEQFAAATHTPIGYLFLPQPPVEQIPIPDFRTVAGGRFARPSADLLDTLYTCQQRQEWYRDFARSAGENPLPFVGARDTGSNIEAAAADIRNALGFDLDERRRLPTWTDTLRRFIEQADALGVLVMVSGVVGSNNRRKLNPDEFRGFALSDPLAPLVFINGADTKAAQMFTLAHELAHLWLGESALSDVGPASWPSQCVEAWCNRVAAELLVPMAVFGREYQRRADRHDETERLARRFKVSTLVILRRMRDAGGLSEVDFWDTFRAEAKKLRGMPKGKGGDFYLTLGARVGKRFARALVASTQEGRSSFTEAFRLLGFKKMATFRDLGRSLGVGF